MAAKKRGTSEDGYNKTFPRILRELIEQNNTTIQAVANQIGITRQAVSQYCNGETQPNGETLLKIADYFGVSCDYLLRGVSSENISIERDLGLSNKSVEILKALKRLDDARNKASFEMFEQASKESFFKVFNAYIENMEHDRIICDIAELAALEKCDFSFDYTNPSSYKAVRRIIGEKEQTTSDMCNDCMSAVAILEAHGCKVLSPQDARDYLISEAASREECYFENVLLDLAHDNRIPFFHTLRYDGKTCSVFEYVDNCIEEIVRGVERFRENMEKNYADDNETE